VPPVINLPAGVVAYLVRPFGHEAVLRAVRLGLAWHQMSLAVRAKRDDRTESIETWLATPAKGLTTPRGNAESSETPPMSDPRFDALRANDPAVAACHNRSKWARMIG
jgi:hypothetical protein